MSSAEEHVASESPTVVREGPESDVSEPVESPASAAPVPLTPGERRELRREVHAGRLAAGNRDVGRALAHFDRALELVPMNARVHCEAGFVALGSDTPAHREYAREHITRGVALFGPGGPPAELRRPVASCLYNRGLDAERTNQLAEAVRFYERSLALRENRTVREHLAHAREGVVVPDEVEDHASVEALIAGWNEAGRCRGPGCEDWDTSVAHVLRHRFAAEGDRPELACIERREPSGLDYGDDIAFVFALRAGDGYRVWARYEGVEGREDTGFRWTPTEAHVVAPGWLRVDYELFWASEYWEELNPEDDDEDGYCDATIASEVHSHHVAFCSIDSEFHCRVFVLARRFEDDVELSCDGEPPAWARARRSQLQRDMDWELSLTVDPDRGVRVTRRRGTPPDMVDAAPPPLNVWVPFASLISNEASP